MKFRSKTFGGLAVAVASIIALGACSSCSSSSPSAAATPVSGGTATFAELPATTPNYIFPFTSSAYISVSNLNLFQYLLYRPLYWFGTGSQPTVNTTKSLANLPVWSNDGKTVTITLKHFMWSNGQPVTAQNIVFWLNMEQAVGDVDYGAYTGFPNAQVTQHDGGQPHHAGAEPEQGLQPAVVPVQRAGPGHADAGGLGRHRVRAEPLLDDGQ